MDPAQASVEPVGPDAEEAPATGYIPIDLGDAVPADHKYEYLSLRAEGMPRGAALSAGQDNGDESWSLMLEDLADLVYIPSPKGLEPHTICFRIVGVRGGFGEGIASVDLPISPDDVIQGTFNAPAAANASEGYDGMAARFQTEIDSEVTRRISSEKAAWEKQAQQLLEEQARAHEESFGAGVNAERAAELEALISDAETRVLSAEQAAQAANEAMGHAMARAEAAEAEAASVGMNEEAETLRAQVQSVRRELSSVKASMRVRSGKVEEIQKEVHDSLQDEFAHQLEELHERYGRELERLTKLVTAGAGAAGAAAGAVAAVAVAEAGADGAENFDARLAEARQRWEQEIAAKLSSVESATKKAILQGRETAVAEARRQWEQEHRETLAAAQAEWQASQLSAAPDPQQQQAEIDAALRQAIAARDEEWQTVLDRRVAEERETWQAAEQERFAAAQVEWQSAQFAPDAGIDEDEIARRIEAAQQEWQAAQNSLIEARDQEWQAELDRRVGEEHEHLAAAQAALASSDTADGDPEAAAAAQEEWAQSQTLEIERRLLEAEEAWQENDEERLQAAKVEWEAEQQVLIAERDEKWKLELVRQLDEAKEAWKDGVEDHTPDLEMPVVAAEDAPVGVGSEDAATGTGGSAGATDGRSGTVGEAVELNDGGLGEEVVLDGEAVHEDELPSFFEEREPEPFLDRELGLQGRRDIEAEADEADDIVPEWMEKWGDRLRIPPHWVPVIHRLSRRVKRLGRFAVSKLRQLIASRKASARPVDPGQLATAELAGSLPKKPATTFRKSKLYFLLVKLGRLASRLVGALLKFVWAVVARLFRLAAIAGVIAVLYHGYYFAKPHVYPHVKPYIESYWDPYVGPYVTVYWDPYVQPYIDTYWGGYAKPHIVNTWNTYAGPYVDGAWDTTKSLANDAWEGVTGFLPDAPPLPKVGASVSKGAANAKNTTGTKGAKPTKGKPKLSAVAPRLYLKLPSATLRSGASKYSAVVGTVRHADHIQRLEENGGWVRIRVVAKKMKVGWVRSAMLAETPAK